MRSFQNNSTTVQELLSEHASSSQSSPLLFSPVVNKYVFTSRLEAVRVIHQEEQQLDLRAVASAGV